MKFRSLLAAGGALAASVLIAYAGGNWSTLPIVGNGSFCGSTVSGTGGLTGITGQGQGTQGSICGQTVPAGPPFYTGNELIPADTTLSGGASPQTVTIPSSLLGPGWGSPRNYLDNGAMDITQRGTGAATCALNGAAITSAAYSADRWGCDVNVASGAGQATVITASPAPPAGFTNSVKLVRNSGSLAQPQCLWQEIPTIQSTQLAGQPVALSFNAAALAGLLADNGNLMTVSIVTGTGTDQGFGTWTASPAITPAWTGINSVVNQSPIALTTTFQRFYVTATIPTTATEIGVALCFTPTTTTSGGATDGFAITGVQLERGPSPTFYEFRSVQQELATAQRYYYQYADNLASTFVIAMCQSNTTTVDICVLPNPVTMRTTPTVAVATATSFAVTIPAGTTQACTTLAAVASTNSPTAIELSCTVAANLVAGSASRFTYSNTGAANTVTVSADF